VEATLETEAPVLQVKNLSFYYTGDVKALKDINLSITKNSVTSIIGPSGCGKSTLIRCINRMHDLYPGTRYEGEIIYNGHNILDDDTNIPELRTKIGMVFQKPTPFPMCIRENVTYGLRLAGITDEQVIKERCEKALKQAAIWDEVADRMDDDASELSGGQQQRLVIARAIATEPDVILFDEPTSALDPLSTSKIEELIVELSKDYTIIVVTHNMEQAKNISDYIIHLKDGELVKVGTADEIFKEGSEYNDKEFIFAKQS